MSTLRRRRRAGYTMIELLLVIGTLAIVFALAAPRMTVIRETSSLRAGRQQLAAAFSAARSAALQKGKTSTLSLINSVAVVSVRSGLAGSTVRVLGPVQFRTSLGVTITPLGDAPNIVAYNARGMMTNVIVGEDQVFRYRLTYGSRADTLCISGAGLILSRQCQL